MKSRITQIKPTLFKGLFFKTCLFTLIFFCNYNVFSQTFNDEDELKNAVNAATNGGTFVVANGTYNDFSATFENMTPSDKPIIIRAESIGGVTLTGDSGFVLKKSSYITIEGFVFNATDAGTLIKFEGCNNIRITRNVFEQTTSSSAKWVYIGGVYDDNILPFQFPSHNNRIDHNTFQNKAGLGHYLTIDGTTDTNDVAYQSQNDRIDHNYFKNNGPRATNEQESIRIGWSEMSQSSGYTTVEYNLFEDCDGDPEIVSVKSCDNVIRHNTFLSSYGTLSLRHGNRNRVEGNYFFGNGKPVGSIQLDPLDPKITSLYTGGVRIYGTDHVIINNYFEGLNGTRWDAPITLTLGDAIDGQSTSWSKHFRAERVLIAYNTLVNNTHGIEIGYDNNDSYSKDLADITIANNLITGSENALVEIVDTDNDQGSKITWLNNLMRPTGSAVTLLGATTTVFNGTTDAIDADPNLVLNTDITYDSTAGVWKTSDMTPEFANAVTSETIDEDIDGQTRPATSNPGADHFSTESIRYNPLTTAEVGPGAYEDDDTSENLYLSPIGNFVAAGGSEAVTVTSNLDWTVSEIENWLSVSPTSGSDNGSFTITVDQNTDTQERTGIVTVAGGTLIRTINVTQEGVDLTDLYNLINDVPGGGPVSVVDFSQQEVGGGKTNYATNTLDKVNTTKWAAEDGAIVDAVKGDGEYVIYDLGDEYELDLIQIATDDKSDPYGLQVWVSTTGTDPLNFTMVLPTTGDLLITTTTGTYDDFDQYEITTIARYVKLIGYGRFNSAGDARSSGWNNITEIVFYGESASLSINDNDLNNDVVLYPVPTKNVLHLKHINSSIEAISIYNILGQKVIEQKFNAPQSNVKINTSSLKDGMYLIHFSTENNRSTSKAFIVSH